MNFGSYANRQEAGTLLARRLLNRRTDRTVILALVRGGVPVAYQIAQALDAPLDVMLVRKLSSPEDPDLALGAIASGGIVVLNDDVVREADVDDQTLMKLAEQEQSILDEAEERYRSKRRPVQLARRSVILVDDGLATGASMRAAIEATRARQPREILVAAPVGSRDACEQMQRLADEVICPICTDEMRSVSQFYREFPQVTEEDVRACLDEVARQHSLPAS